jgi:phage regulator Rha-like protein
MAFKAAFVKKWDRKERKILNIAKAEGGMEWIE